MSRKAAPRIALVSLALVTITAVAASAAGLLDSGVKFRNDTGHTVNMYMNGKMMVENASPGSLSMFRFRVDPGKHTFAVTPFHQALGANDLYVGDVEVKATDTLLEFSEDGVLDFDEETGEFALDDYDFSATGPFEE